MRDYFKLVTDLSSLFKTCILQAWMRRVLHRLYTGYIQYTESVFEIPLDSISWWYLMSWSTMSKQ